MNRYFKIRTVVFLWGVLIPLILNSESLDFMRNLGKIYVVYSVITIIFIGIILFLIRLERKISKIEKSLNNER